MSLPLWTYVISFHSVVAVLRASETIELGGKGRLHS